MKKVLFALCLCTLFLTACRTVKVIDYGSSVYGKTETDVEQAIFIGCADRAWACEKIADGQIEGTFAHGSYKVVVDIVYKDVAPESYKIIYKNSARLNYKEGRKKSTIHKAYEKWVIYLSKSIRKALVDPAWAKKRAATHGL